MRGISRAEATGGYRTPLAPQQEMSIEPLWHRNRRCPMTHAKRLWSIWQALLSAFAWAFTRPSFRRFAEWVTAMAINGEEHTITQSVLALERPADWKGVIAPVPGIMRLFWAFSSSNPPESPSQEDSSLANMLDTLEARCRSDGPPAGPRSIDPLPGSRSFLTVSAVA